RTARSAARTVAGIGDGHRRPGRLRRRAGQAAVGRPEEAAVPGAVVVVTGTAVVAGRALRKPRPGRDRAGQPHGPGPAAGWRGRAGPHPWRLRRPAGAHPHAAAGARGMNPPTMPSAAHALLLRDLRLLWRRQGDALQPALFALLVVVLFALA